MKKIIILVLVVVLLVVCTSALIIVKRGADDSNTNNPSNNPATTSGDINIIQEKDQNQQEDNKKILYFFYNSFVGYLKDGKWYGLEDITYNELLNNEKFVVYKNKDEKTLSKKVELSRNSFIDSDYNYETVDQKEEVVELKKYASENNVDGLIFNLPTKIDSAVGQEQCEMWSEDSSAISLYINENGEDVIDGLIAYNADYNLKFADESKIEKLPEDAENLLKEWLVENGVSKDCPYEIVQCFDVDLNNDGKKDEVYNLVSYNKKDLFDHWDDASMEKMDFEIQKNGYFSGVFAKINDKFSVIDSQIISIEDAKELTDMLFAAMNYGVYIVDLNEDGIYEMLFELTAWEFLDCELYTYSGDGYSYIFDR